MQCAICICVNDTLPVYMLHCGHAFHSSCIRNWYIECHRNRTYEERMRDPAALSPQNPCPMCRQICTDDDWDAVINGSRDAQCENGSDENCVKVSPKSESK